ncbi:hypothetical protein [Bradyrhizobium sp. JYMT SZCCT0428]|uniref:hypothetical protein n=1 Tax=Bradyrhizobium sp. JYMT SZCCT0428 TaxID=2807673 RepID=UPI002010E78C|nr:hypothetical protein [Bradyrhizobium sp. JYMT SZCCT0428]
MLLTAGLDDFNKVRFRQTIGISQNGRGHQGVIVKRELADGLAWREIRRGQGLAQMDERCWLDPPDQGDKDAIERSYLGFTEAIDIGQEQGRHLLQNSGIPLRRLILGGAGPFRD